MKLKLMECLSFSKPPGPSNMSLSCIVPALIIDRIIDFNYNQALNSVLIVFHLLHK